MDKSILIEYADMKEEIKDLRHRIDKGTKELERLNQMVVSDSVTCGKKGKKPLRTVKIQGRPVSAIKRKERLLEQRIAKMERLEMELLELTNQVEDYIQQIEKSELRIMFRFYFLDDLTYSKVADRMNGMFQNREIAYTDESIRKRIQRFFENVPQCPVPKCYSIN